MRKCIGNSRMSFYQCLLLLNICLVYHCFGMLIWWFIESPCISFDIDCLNSNIISETSILFIMIFSSKSCLRENDISILMKQYHAIKNSLTLLQINNIYANVNKHLIKCMLIFEYIHVNQ